MKHLKTLNELNTWTYHNAARKLTKMGHKGRANDLMDHSYDMQIKNAEKYNIGQCTFEGDHVGEFLSYDEHMSLDTFSDGCYDTSTDTFDYENGWIFWPLFFRFDEKNESGENSFNPFYIDYDIANDRVNIGSEYAEGLQEAFGIPGEEMLFNNRRDANKVVRSLRSIEFPEKMMEDEHFTVFKENFDKMVNKLSVNQLWRS